MILEPEDPRQMEFVCRADIVQEEPLVQVVSDVVSELDLGRLYERYREGGRPFFDPAMQLKVLFFAYCDGVRSSRAIAKHTRFDIRYRYFCGSLRPDFRTINRFRKDNLDLLGDYFAQIVLMCRERGLVDSSLVALDGTKIRASASGRKSRRRSQRHGLSAVFRKRLSEDAAAEDDSETVAVGDTPEENDGRGLEVSDPDARYMKTSEKSLRLSYNSQVVVDRNQFIVAQDVTNCADDKVQLQPMLEQSKQVLGHPPARAVVDAGYYSGENLSYGVKEGIDLYIPPARTGRVPDERFHRYEFEYESSTDRYRCPAGQYLTFRGSRRRDGKTIRLYAGGAATCGCCQFRQQCTTGRYRRLDVSSHHLHERAMQRKMASEQGRQVSACRKHMVEAVFGNMKFNLGFARFQLRTIPKVAGEFALMCIAHNLKKILTHGFVRPKKALSAAHSTINGLCMALLLILSLLEPINRPDNGKDPLLASIT